MTVFVVCLFVLFATKATVRQNGKKMASSGVEIKRPKNLRKTTLTRITLDLFYTRNGEKKQVMVTN